MNIIKKELENILLREKQFQNKINKLSKKSNSLIIEDYDSFEKVINNILLNESGIFKLNFVKYSKESESYHFLFKIVLAYNIKIYNSLIEKIHTNTFYSWEEENKEKDIFIILMYKQNINSLVSAYQLLCENLNFQSMQLLRGYIESSAILYLSLLDFNFLKEYLNSENVSDSEYTQMWFKKLKPSVVKKNISKIHHKWKIEDKKEGIEHIGLRSMSDLMNSNAIESFYKLTSNYIHFNSKTILEESYSKKISGFHLGLEPMVFKNKNLNILDIIHLSSDVTMYMRMVLSSHINFIKDNKVILELSNIMHELIFQFIYKDRNKS